MTIKMNSNGNYAGANGHSEVIRAMMQTHAHTITAAVAAPTNNAGGTAGTIIVGDTTFANEADASTSLANATETDAAYDTVHNAIRELMDKANAVAAVLPVAALTGTPGGAATDGTIAAITVTVAAAATGAQASNLNTTIGLMDEAILECAHKVNELCRATGVAEMAITNTDGIATNGALPTVTVAVGSAADPGVSKAAVDAHLAKYRTNVTTIAAKLITLCTSAEPLAIAH